jgi:hypothetical protein
MGIPIREAYAPQRRYPLALFFPLEPATDGQVPDALPCAIHH